MIAEAIKLLLNAGKPEFKADEHGNLYSDKPFMLINGPAVRPIALSSLTGLCDFCKGGEVSETSALVVVSSHRKVSVVSLLDGSYRDIYLTVSPAAEEVSLDGWYDLEDFIIRTRAKCADSEELKGFLSFISQLSSVAETSLTDDGVHQGVAVKKGITRVTEARTPNPVSLRPFKTFPEIEQPEIPFIFRLRDDGNCIKAALFPADGGKYVVTAIQSIREFLQKKLEGWVILA